MVAERNPEVKKAVVKLQELSADERTRHLYESQEMLRRDIASEKKWALKQQAFETAKKALLKKISVEDIIDITDLTRGEIEQLKSTI